MKVLEIGLRTVRIISSDARIVVENTKEVTCDPGAQIPFRGVGLIWKFQSGQKWLNVMMS